VRIEQHHHGKYNAGRVQHAFKRIHEMTFANIWTLLPLTSKTDTKMAFCL
jgi:hypothetical protein